MFNGLEEIEHIRRCPTWIMKQARYSAVAYSDYWDTDKYVLAKEAVGLINVIDSELARRSR